MFNLNDVTIVVPSTLNKVTSSWISQINMFSLSDIQVIISVPPEYDIKEAYSKGFLGNINISKSIFVKENITTHNLVVEGKSQLLGNMTMKNNIDSA